MLCQFERLLYPKNISGIQLGSYMIALYRPCERVVDGGGNRVMQIKAVGYGLPTASSLRYDIKGHWNRDSKHGIQFEVENYEEVITHDEHGIVAYLSCGQIYGIGPKLAEKIYAKFGNDTLDVLDKHPEKLLDISGITERKLKKICESYLANRAARDIVAFLLPYGITPNRAVKFFQKYGARTMEVVKEHPYTLCEMSGIGFITADKIAKSMGFGDLSTDRVDAALLYTLTEAESCGHLCMEKHKFIENCIKLLQTPSLTEEMVANRAARLVYNNELMCYNDMVYRAWTAVAEIILAKHIVKRLSTVVQQKYADLDTELDTVESNLGLKLAIEQRNAVKTALTNGLSIITGGPGTGKTMIQRAILDIYRRQNPDKKICCCAPTGRAARRMTQATEFGASTIHRALGLMADEDGAYDEPKELDADLLLVDEVSMLDVYLAGSLLGAVKKGAQVVFIGDADQLPSVGPGAVLSEMIASECVPVIRLDKVFRQSSGSRIATNAKLIRHGNLGLEYGDDFCFIDSPDITESAELLIELFLRETEKHGVDNVALLSPFRQKTETGVNALNTYLQSKINPPSSTKNEVECGKRLFRVGDKVMQTKNHEDVNNGDIGYVTEIYGYGNDKTLYVDFGDGRIKEYEGSDLDRLDLGYASTVHKSQGSEYKSVIINLQSAHSVMLTRPLIYTAITRGKERVIIVGERKALCTAIKRTDTEKRGTCLAERIKENIKKISGGT